MTQEVESWLSRNHFLLRRLHSLSGIVPVGAFLMIHLFTNSLAWWPEKYNEEVFWIHRMPFVLVIETLFIFLPIAFHAIYGVAIARTGRSNASQYPYMDNWRYTLQRVTAWIALVFIIVHLAHFRFAHWFGGPKYMGTADPFGATQEGFYISWIGAAWLIYAFYVIGTVSCVYHFCNGIVTFCITWGITVGDESRKRVTVGAAALGVLLTGWGMLSLGGIRSRVSPFEGSPPAQHVALQADAGEQTEQQLTAHP